MRQQPLGFGQEARAPASAIDKIEDMKMQAYHCVRIDRVRADGTTSSPMPTGRTTSYFSASSKKASPFLKILLPDQPVKNANLFPYRNLR